jgi:ABC-type Mn2+/Zn2+ transport system permease subunit
MMIASCIFSVLFAIGGLALGWVFNLPIGATTVIIAGVVFIGFSAYRAVRRN